jgi:hypothetical protein
VLIAVVLIGYVLSRIDVDAFIAALDPTALGLLFAFALVWNATLLTADAWATSRVYNSTVCPVRFRELWVIRGASYLPSLLNHHVGQGWVTYFLSKVYGAPLWRVAGATLVVYASTFACLVAFAFAALAFGSALSEWFYPVLVPLSVAGVAFLAVVRWRPVFLTRRALLSPLLEIGVRGHLKHAAMRGPHMFVLFLGSWVPLHLFGVHVPLFDALGLVPPVLLLAALPLTPQGVGVRDTFSVHLFAAYALGTPDQAAARVAASTLGWAAALVCVQVAFSPLLMRRAYELLRKKAEAQPAVQDPT